MISRLIFRLVAETLIVSILGGQVATVCANDDQIVLTLKGDLPATQDRIQVAPEKFGSFVSIRDTISTEFSGIALKDAIQRIADASLSRIVFIDSGLGDRPVFAALNDLPIDQALDTTLSNFSYYIHYQNANTVLVRVYSENGYYGGNLSPARTTVFDRLQVSHKSVEINKSDHYHFSIENHVKQDGVIPVDNPPTLEAFRSIVKEPSNLLLGNNRDSVESQPLAPDYKAQVAYQEAKIVRALDVIQAGYTNLFEEAVDEVLGANDRRVTDLLINNAVYDLWDNHKIRLYAANALVDHATDLFFSDQRSVNAISQMAQDNDSEIRRIGENGLLTMRYYLEDQKIVPK